LLFACALGGVLLMKILSMSLKSVLAVIFLSLIAFNPGLSSAGDAFTPINGVWSVENVDGASVYRVDGSQHKVSIREHFPIAVYSEVKDFHEGELSVRFKPLSGKSDQAGGIVFDRKENGDYLVLRANALEGNLNLYRYVSGLRTPIKEVGNAPAPAGTWHELKIVIIGTSVKGYLDGALLLEHTLDHTVSGGIGLWSKDDSVTLFKDFNVATRGQ